MKKIMLFIFVLAVPSFLAASGDFSLWTGYSYSSLSRQNSKLLQNYNNSDTRDSLTRLGGGITAGLDGAYWYYAWWGIGGRTSYTELFEGSESGTALGFPVSTKIGGSLFQFLAGVPLLFEFFDGKMSLGAGIYAGWGYADIITKVTVGSTAGMFEAGANTFVFETPLRVTWHISSSFLLDLDLSWKSANSGNLSVNKATGSAATAFTIGQKLGYAADFSGVMAGLGFNWRFSSHDWPWYKKKFSFTE